MPVPAPPGPNRSAPSAAMLALCVLGTVAATLLAQAAWNRLSWMGKPAQVAPQLTSEETAQAIVDLNTATPAELAQLPGVGPALAERIVARRPFRDLAQLETVVGLGPAKLERLRPYLCIAQQTAVTRDGDPAAAVSLDLNTATREQLIALPGIGPMLADRIIEDRRLRGPYHQPEDLMRVKGIKNKLFEKLRPFVIVAPNPVRGRDVANG